MILYFIKVCLVSASLFLIYRLFLKKRTPITFNRFFLLIILLVSALIPTLDFSIVIPEDQAIFYEGSKAIFELEERAKLTEVNIENKSTALDWSIGVSFLYFFISFLLFIRFILVGSRLFSKRLTKGEPQQGMRVFYHENKGIYSFFNRIYLPIQQANIDSTIWQHEKAHYRQLHSIDNILAEMYLIIFWLNPISWFIGRDIKENHEFLADQKVVKDYDALQYMKTILQQCQEQKSTALYSSFSYLSIKNRIKMLQTPSKHPIKQFLLVSIGLILSGSLIALFSFKPAQINKKINNQVSTNFGVDLFKRPVGLPINPKHVEKVSSGFGVRIHPVTKTKKMHTGVDLIAAKGTEILTIGDGKVLKAEYSEGYGYHIVIQHNMKYKSMYAHLKSLNVKEGDFVKIGDVIGIIGNSGKSLGTHLHFELHEFDQKVDPDIKIDC